MQLQGEYEGGCKEKKPPPELVSLDGVAARHRSERTKSKFIVLWSVPLNGLAINSHLSP